MNRMPRLVGAPMEPSGPWEMSQAEACSRLRDWLLETATATHPGDDKLIFNPQDVPAASQKFANLASRISMSRESIDLTTQVFLDDRGEINAYVYHRFEQCKVIPAALNWFKGRHIGLIPDWMLLGMVSWQAQGSTVFADDLASAIQGLADDDRLHFNIGSASTEERIELLERLNDYTDGLGEGATSHSQFFVPSPPPGSVPVTETLKLYGRWPKEEDRLVDEWLPRLDAFRNIAQELE